MTDRQEYMRKYNREYREKNRDKLKRYMSEYRRANKDKIAKRAKRWREENYQQARASEKRSRAKHIDKHRYDSRLRMRRLRAVNPEKYTWIARKSRHKNKYGMTPQDWRAMFQSQGERCAICQTDRPGPYDWHTDHCHTTGKVRGILCSKCNLMLGHAKDDPDRLRAAAAYLEKHK